MPDVALVSVEQFLIASKIVTNLSYTHGSLLPPTTLWCLEESSEATRVLESHD